MKSVVIGLLITIGLFATIRVFTFKGKPPLKTWHLESTTQGSEKIDVSFRTPIRDSHPSYWSYNLGLVLTMTEEFELSGTVVVVTADKRRSTTLTFDRESVTRSSWLREEDRISYLLGDDFGMRDDEEYHLEIQLDRPVRSDLSIVLHFLSHTDPQQKKPNKTEMATPRKPSD
jgi:predicted secreted protein